MPERRHSNGRVEQAEIQTLLPHRYPFLLVDRIKEFEPHQRMVGIKNVTINEPFFQGHFPGRPVMPGVLIIEAMAQVGGVLAFKSLGPSASRHVSDGYGRGKISQTGRAGRSDFVLRSKSSRNVRRSGKCKAKAVRRDEWSVKR